MSIDLCDEEGGGTVELVTNGKIQLSPLKDF